ncbi:hypothetical protein B566_EDAN006196 [Ephemera danica]|nr:hypothetical protein B566_EDAN006196 [Ephemera danica]
MHCFIMSEDADYMSDDILESWTEPVPVVLKVDRQGFGREAALRELATQRQAIRARHRTAAQNLDLDGFRQRHSQRATERQTLSDLHKSQRVCEQLDTQQNVTEAVHSWFWPQREKATEEDEEQKKDSEEKEEEREEPEEEFEPSEQLEMLTLYLRRSYCYCVWCGTKFDDDKDLGEDCPGPTRDDH